MTIPELFNQELDFWIIANIKFLGVEPIDDTWDYSHIQESINESCDKYWNTDKPCKLAVKLNSGLLNKDASKQTKNSYQLKLNFYNMCIDVFGDYGEQGLLKICAIPTPCRDLCWIINRTHYVTRVAATKDLFGCISKQSFDLVHGEGWTYTISEDKFECIITKDEYVFEPTLDEIFDNHLSKRSIYLLTAVLGEPLTKANFKKAMKSLPTFDKSSVFNYKFTRMEYFEDAVLNSRKYAQPTKGILLGVNTIISSKSKQYTTSGEKLDGCLVRSESKIFALENFRTCANFFNVETAGASASSVHSKFTYSDANGFFDSFKTVTSKSAGRQRLLLDNIVTKHGLLWVVDENGDMHNMFEYMDMPQNERLSCLSKAPFCNNDKPKRIMMNAKMTSQAVPLADEIDELTHRITARVGFTDIEGYTAADSIIISESFAKKLRTYDQEILYLDKNSNLYKTLTDENLKFDLLTLKQIFPKKNDAILLSFENVKVDHIDHVDDYRARVFITWEIPFRLGDKITNLHGAKGTVGLILPDDKMPRLTKQVGNMKAGPLEIIISGFSAMRRGSLGQLFEAWSLATGHTDVDFIAEAIDKYGKEMEDYSKKSVVEYNGQKSTIPVGINYIMRLYHHASTKVSCSSADFAYKRTLRFGEMEKLNLVANDCPNILKELGIRSVTKYIGSHRLINQIEETRELPKNAHMSLQFVEILKSMGYKLTVSRLSDDYSKMDERDEEYVNDRLKNKEGKSDENDD